MVCVSRSFPGRHTPVCAFALERALYGGLNTACHLRAMCCSLPCDVASLRLLCVGSGCTVCRDFSDPVRGVCPVRGSLTRVSDYPTCANRSVQGWYTPFAYVALELASLRVGCWSCCVLCVVCRHTTTLRRRACSMQGMGALCAGSVFLSCLWCSWRDCVGCGGASLSLGPDWWCSFCIAFPMPGFPYARFL